MKKGEIPEGRTCWSGETGESLRPTSRPGTLAEAGRDVGDAHVIGAPNMM